MNPICTASFYCRGMNLLALALLIVPSANAEDAAVTPAVTAFFQTYCSGCHGPKKQQGDFRVDALKIAASTADAENWQLVLENLQLGEMPPKDAKQPKQTEVEQVTRWIQSLQEVGSLSLDKQVELEDANIAASVKYAREDLAL